MKTAANIVLGMLLCLSAAAFAHPPQPCAHFCHHHGASTPAAVETFDFSGQLVIGQNLVTETVTCDYVFAHYDRRQYGAIETSGCTATGALAAQDGNTGHVGVSLDLPGGALDLKGCSIDATASGWDTAGAFVQIDVNCIHY